MKLLFFFIFRDIIARRDLYSDFNLGLFWVWLDFLVVLDFIFLQRVVSLRTTCPEVCLAKELGIPYASIAIVTGSDFHFNVMPMLLIIFLMKCNFQLKLDYDCWREHVDDSEHVGVEAVFAVFRQTIGKVTDLIVNAVPAIAAHEWHTVLDASKQLVLSSIVH